MVVYYPIMMRLRSLRIYSYSYLGLSLVPRCAVGKCGTEV